MNNCSTFFVWPVQKPQFDKKMNEIKQKQRENENKFEITTNDRLYVFLHFHCANHKNFNKCAKHTMLRRSHAVEL